MEAWFVVTAPDPPPPPDLGLLEEVGLQRVDDETLRTRIAEHSERRMRVRWMVTDTGSAWEDVAPPPAS